LTERQDHQALSGSSGQRTEGARAGLLQQLVAVIGECLLDFDVCIKTESDVGEQLGDPGQWQIRRRTRCPGQWEVAVQRQGVG
jgi:hypothetical protein